MQPDFSITTHLCCCCHSYQKGVFFFLSSFCFLDVRGTSMITVRCGHQKQKQKRKHFNCKLLWTESEGWTKIKINFSNVIQDAWGRIISDQNVGWNSDETNLRKLSFRLKCGRPGFRTRGGKKNAGQVGANMQDCWLNVPSFYCRQFARYYENRTCSTKRAPLHWLTRCEYLAD